MFQYGRRDRFPLCWVRLHPSCHGLSRLAFRSPLVSQLAAAMMAVSRHLPARQETAAVGLLPQLPGNRAPFMSTRFTSVAKRQLDRKHFRYCYSLLFSLSLCAEALVLIGFLILDCRLAINPKSLIPNLKSLCAVAAGTLVGGLVWLPVLWQNSYNSQLTEWIQSGERVGLLAWVSPASKPGGLDPYCPPPGGSTSYRW